MSEPQWVVSQRKAFTGWINSILSENNHPTRVVNLETDLTDAKVLEELLCILAKMPPIKTTTTTRNDRVHKMDYLATLFKSMRETGLKVDDISPEDVLDGHKKLILALIWRMILKFQLEQHTSAPVASSSSSTATEAAASAAIPTSTTENSASAKQNLLRWAQGRLKPFNIVVENFTSSWVDGVAFLGLLKSEDATLLDLAAHGPEHAKENLDKAFTLGETVFGIFKLLDVEDMVAGGGRVDEKCVMTYVSMMQQKLNGQLNEVQENAKRERAEHERIKLMQQEEAKLLEQLRVQTLKQEIESLEQRAAQVLASNQFDDAHALFQEAAQKWKALGQDENQHRIDRCEAQAATAVSIGEFIKNLSAATDLMTKAALMEAEGKYEEAAWKYAEAEAMFRKEGNESERVKAEERAELCLTKADEQRQLNIDAKTNMDAGDAAMAAQNYEEATTNYKNAYSQYKEARNHDGTEEASSKLKEAKAGLESKSKMKGDVEDNLKQAKIAMAQHKLQVANSKFREVAAAFDKLSLKAESDEAMKLADKCLELQRLRNKAEEFMVSGESAMTTNKYKIAEKEFQLALQYYNEAEDIAGVESATEALQNAKTRQGWLEKSINVSIRALRARNIKAKPQRMDGLADPYIKIKCPWDKAMKLKSPIVKDSINPDFPPHDMSLNIKFGYRESYALIASLWNANPLGNTCIESFSIPIADVCGEVPGTFTGERTYQVPGNTATVTIAWSCRPN